ncbi:hypothetical protein B0H17DRAFT_1147668 [Mycena rosella]|uniref:Uncharacterized protein n=1 Tax=Mycena rosella TaxID=1033263 RepID=A0AAD7CLA7_MYCRO|nr:hypothetical protein B0H17DRAFT_1147668 [Mycena rosella]
MCMPQAHTSQPWNLLPMPAHFGGAMISMQCMDHTGEAEAKLFSGYSQPQGSWVQIFEMELLSYEAHYMKEQLSTDKKVNTRFWGVWSRVEMSRAYAFSHAAGLAIKSDEDAWECTNLEIIVLPFSDAAYRTYLAWKTSYLKLSDNLTSSLLKRSEIFHSIMDGWTSPTSEFWLSIGILCKYLARKAAECFKCYGIDHLAFISFFFKQYKRKKVPKLRRGTKRKWGRVLMYSEPTPDPKEQELVLDKEQQLPEEERVLA